MNTVIDEVFIPVEIWDKFWLHCFPFQRRFFEDSNGISRESIVISMETMEGMRLLKITRDFTSRLITDPKEIATLE